MLLDLFLFALIGLLAGAVARWLIPRQQVREVLVTTALGLVGSLVGGMVSWAFWQPEEGEFHLANLVMALVMALIVLGLYALSPRPNRA
jgi:uncharacterized membrane protein YeaQ/YmgE (transglycosylase-associated protein family)